MDRRFILFAFLLSLLLSPSFAEDYIVVTSNDSLDSLQAFAENDNSSLQDVELRPLYGTDDFSADLTEEQASVLEANGYEVYPDLEIHAFLDDTVGQINVTPVWNTIVGGKNLTGSGQAICLIDSGLDDINYTVLQNAWEDGKILEGRAFYTEDSSYINATCTSIDHTACFDDDGHGTTVAEVLVSNHSIYRGIAYNSNLVIVKTLNRTRGGTQSDLIAGINYCVNVSQEYNISVISLSLGTSETSSVHCDSADWMVPLLREAVDNAAAANISIIAASGNGASSTNLSAPACLSNVTPVGSVNKSDSRSSSANYWNLPMLFAPGEAIAFPGVGGEIYLGSGTSYSTPHVAGVFALMNQYLALTGRSKTPSELKSLAVSTGKNLTSNLNQSRIDAYALYLNLSDDLFVAINSPLPNAVENTSVLAVSGASSDSNTTIYVHYTNGTIFNSTNTIQTSWSVNFTLPDGVYNLTAVVSNGTNSTNTTVANITIDTLNPQIAINSPDANSYLSSRAISINLTVTEGNIDYTGILVNYANGTLANSTNTSQNGTFVINLSVPTDGNYTIIAAAYDKAGNFNTMSSSNITVDTTSPQVIIHSPANNTVLNVRTVAINITVNESSLNYTNISVIDINGTVINSTIDETSGNYAMSLSVPSDGIYSVNVSVYDLLGGLGSVSAANLTILAAPTLKIRPSWADSYYLGNKTVSAGVDSEAQNTSRSLYYGLNQTKTILFYVNNSGVCGLDDVSASLEGFDGANVNLSWQDGSSISALRNISANASAVLNLTIQSPGVTGLYAGSIYINTSNGEPYPTLNLTLVLNVTEQTLPRLNNSDGKYYADSGNLAHLGFYVYYQDNQTLDTDFGSNYSVGVVNSSGSAVSNITFSAANGFFLGYANASALPEGTYNLSSEFNDTLNNTVFLNLPFELLQNAGLSASISPNENLIVKGSTFQLIVNVSKNGTYDLANGTLCISAPAQMNYTSNRCRSSVNVTGGSSAAYNWTITGSARGDYTVNITFSTEDGRFNRTLQKSVTVRYGELTLEWYTSTTPPAQVEKSQTFNVKAIVSNDGNLNASGVAMDLTYDSGYFEISSGADPCSVGTLQAQDDYTCIWTMKAKTSTVTDSTIKVTLSANNATLPVPTYVQKDVDVVNPTEAAQNEVSSTAEGSQAAAAAVPALYFINPEISELALSQSQNHSLLVTVKNNGSVSIANLYLSIDGIDPSAYTIDSNGKAALAAGASRSYMVRFSIPVSMEAKKYALSLKAVSDQSTWTKVLELTVRGIGVEVSGLESVSVTQGEAKGYLVSIKNNGGRDLNNVRVHISNLEADRFIIAPDIVSKIPQTAQQSYNFSFSIPKDEPMGQRDLTLAISSDEGNLSYNFALKILPDEDQKERMAELYENLSKDFLAALKKYERADLDKANLTGIQEQLNLTNQTMALINASLEKGDYLEAKRLMDQAQESLSEIEMSLADVKEGSGPASIFQAIIFIFGAMLVGMAVFYAIVPKKAPGKVYVTTPKSGVDGGETKKKFTLNIFRKASKKDEHEEQREQILEEWRERYELGKKKKPYGE